ncbi:MAG TPA: ATP-binding protein [Candidatus Angelobacter sp.]|nr:ATP-binding protein [Candidatus Angelobacter sp.]
MAASRGIVVSGVVLVVIKLVLLPFQGSLPTNLLLTLTDALLAFLITFSAWRASRRSGAYARVFWLCVSLAALIWTINFTAGALGLRASPLQSSLSARWPSLVISSFPFAIALTLPLLLREDPEKMKVGWLQALDLIQFGIIVFSAFLVLFYIPSFHLVSDIERVRYLTRLHVTRDGILALGFLYRGWRSRFSDLRRLHFRMSGFLVAYGLSSLSVPALHALGWPDLSLSIVSDLPPLFLLITAATWRQRDVIQPAHKPGDHKGMLWTQAAAVVMPISVVALASRLPSQYLRVAWIMVTCSFVCYAGRLLLMHREQSATLSRLVATEEKFSKAFRSSPAAITISRLSDGKFIDVNDRCLQLMKRTREEMIGNTSIDLGLFENSADRARLVDALRKNGSVHSMSIRFRTVGRILHTLVSAEIVEFEGEALMIASMLDMTEFESTIQQLHHAQKMELVGSLAGGVAHDFNNLLTVITGYSALALGRQLDSELKEEIAQIKEAAGRAASLTQQLLAFSRRQVLQPRNISLNAVLAPIEKLLRRTLGGNVELVTSLEQALGTVHADPAQMEQVVINLAVNARDAMPNGGKLFFETKNLELSSPYPERGFEIPAGRYVMLAITDTGTGIPPELQDRIFEPFFTTKEIGSGTGLGLSTVYGIVKQSGGYVWVYSDVGVGTTFKICLPRVDSAVDTFRPLESGPDTLRGSETVLVVDDDVRVCELTAKVLRQYGYQVIVANSGDDALRCAGQFDGEIHLLVTDVVMPKTSGKDLAQRLRSARPRLSVLYMSGYPHLALRGDSVVDFRSTILPKPFAPSELARQARKAINSRA